MTPFKQILLLCASLHLLVSCGGLDETPRLASETRASDPKAQAIFNEGLAAEKAGKRKRALKRYRTINERYPLFFRADEAAWRRGRLLEQESEPLEAFEAYHDLLTKYPASPHYLDALKRQVQIAHGAAEGNITRSFVGIKSRIGVKETAEMLRQLRDNAPRAPSAERAQHTLGRLFQKEGSDRKNSTEAINAYRELTREYPNSHYAPDALLQIGKILLASAKSGNQNTANLDQAQQAFDDLLIRYPDSEEAEIAKTEIANLRQGEIKRTFDIAEFYRKKGNIPSALFYYQETVNRSQQGSLRAQAQGWIQKLRQP